MDSIVFDAVKKVSTRDGSVVTNYEAQIDGFWYSVPLDPANRHYAEIMRQVEAGELTIEPADEPE